MDDSRDLPFQSSSLPGIQIMGKGIATDYQEQHGRKQNQKLNAEDAEINNKVAEMGTQKRIIASIFSAISASGP
jgi:hypothetical protein